MWGQNLKPTRILLSTHTHERFRHGSVYVIYWSL